LLLSDYAGVIVTAEKITLKAKNNKGWRLKLAAKLNR